MSEVADSGDTAVTAPTPIVDMIASEAGQSAPVQAAEEVDFKIQFGKNSSDVKRPYDSTIGDLKLEIEKQLGIPAKLQKLMFKGTGLKDEAATLRQAGIKTGAKLMLIGSAPTAVEAAQQAPAAAAAGGTWEDAKSDEPLHKQAQHAKVLAKGKPEDALPGIAGRQVTLDDKVTAIPGLLNSQGSKVRLTFKDDMQQLWIGSATATQKVPYNSIAKIEAFPIPDAEGYSILAVQLGASGTSRYWLYYFPSQYVAGLKIKILGVHSLI